MRKKVLKICIGTWQNASHDKRELSAVQALGAETEVMAKGSVSGVVEEVDGFKVTRMSARPLKKYAPRSVNRFTALFTWAAAVRKLAPDVITGKNLGGLTIGYLSNFGRRHKAKLVYDSHEFELGRVARLGRVHSWAIARLERFLMRRCAFSVMVSDSIADEVQRIHRLKERPVVARNVPPYWELDPAETARVRAGFFEKLNLPEDTFLVMYHGWLMRNRGIEQLLRAAAKTTGTAVVILGNAHEPVYLESIRALCETLKIADRVLFHPAVPVEKLRDYVGAADAGVSLLQPTVQNHILALPNKFFENIQSMTPVIVSDFPTIGDIVSRYGIGLRVNPESPEEIAAAIQRLKDDREFYALCKENLKRAKQELCWQTERQALQNAYRRILE